MLYQNHVMEGIITISAIANIFLWIQILIVVSNWKVIVFYLITGSFGLMMVALKFNIMAE